MLKVMMQKHKYRVLYLFLIVILMVIQIAVYGQANCAECSNPPAPYSQCTPLADDVHYILTSEEHLMWTSSGHPTLGKPAEINYHLRFTGTTGSEIVEVDNSDLKLLSGGQLVVENCILRVNKGNLLLESSDNRFIANNITLEVAINFAQTEDSYVCIQGCYVEIGDEGANGQFNTLGTSSTLANWQNNGGFRYVRQTCANVTQNVTNTPSAEDIWVNDCFEIGDRGSQHAWVLLANDGTDSGSLQNDGSWEFWNSEILIPNGSFVNTSSGDLLFCDARIGNFHSGDFVASASSVSNGCELMIYVDDNNGGEINISSGANFNVDVEKWHGTIGDASIPNAPNESTEAVIEDCYRDCPCFSNNPEIPCQIAVSATKTDVTCNSGSDGTGTISIVGGLAPFTFNWSNGSTSQNQFTLSSAIYTVTVTDVSDCTGTATINITEPSAITPNVTGEVLACFDDNDGEINLIVIGGTPDYSYSWSNGATTQDLSGLSAGTYTVTITDSNDCTTTAIANITQPNVLVGIMTGDALSCNGDMDGTASVSPIGGTTDFSYNWSNGGNTQMIPNLSVGTYTVTVTDANNCIATGVTMVVEPNELALATTLTNATCRGGNNGAIGLTVSGGTPSYTYAWSNGSNLEDISNLSPNIYIVTVTDDNNCTATIEAIITAPLNAKCGRATIKRNN